MKDLDFDELDRAVNSLMTNVPDSDMSKPEETEKTLNLTPTIGDSPVSSPSTLNDTQAKPLETPNDAPVISSAPTPLAAPSSRSAPAARRGGRFMDVVHPSSDMKMPTVPPRSAVSRQGVTITPGSSASTPTPAEKPALPPAELQPPVSEVEPSTAVSLPAATSTSVTGEQPASTNDWPDPLEMAGFKSDSTAKEMSAEPEVSEPKDDDTVPEEKPQEEPTPLTSPFLSGAKVDKRPLGGSGTEPADEPGRAPAFGAKADSDLAIADPSAQLPPTPSEMEPELPEELHGDLMAVEADTTTHRKEEKPEESDDASKEKSEPTPKSEHANMPNPMIAPPSDEKLLTAGPTSIAQQYREEPNTGDQDNGAIYDTDNYHQPLAHPAKKKSGWLWIIWIILILALGAGAGAALYLLGIV